MGLQVGKILGFQTSPIKATEFKQFVPKNELLPTYGADRGSSLVKPEGRTSRADFADADRGMSVYYLA